jgi:MtN3 and saliva related transmembrane protein
MISPTLVTAIGLAAGALTTSALIPQAVRIWRTKSAKDVSLTMLIVMVIGIILWIAFGLLRSEFAIIVTNAVALVIAIGLLVLKIRHS